MLDIKAKDRPFYEDLITRKEVVFRKRSNARRYIVRVDEEGQIVVTLPKRGTQRDALVFANQHRDWLRAKQGEAKQLQAKSESLGAGSEIWFKGERHELSVVSDWGRPVLAFADQRHFISDASMDLKRPLAEKMKRLARESLPKKARELAEQFGLEVKRVTIRDQKTRWGSCSSSGTISLNWRLVQAPCSVQEYILIHELMHLREMNHSPQFWRLVEEACPDYRDSEQWLDTHHPELTW